MLYFFVRHAEKLTGLSAFTKSKILPVVTASMAGCDPRSAELG
jgi:hypothetical protein